jgi:hypothetical protein
MEKMLMITDCADACMRRRSRLRATQMGVVRRGNYDGMQQELKRFWPVLVRYGHSALLGSEGGAER